MIHLFCHLRIQNTAYLPANLLSQNSTLFIHYICLPHSSKRHNHTLTRPNRNCIILLPLHRISSLFTTFSPSSPHFLPLHHIFSLSNIIFFSPTFVPFPQYFAYHNLTPSPHNAKHSPHIQKRP